MILIQNKSSLLFNFDSNKLIGIQNKGFNYSNKGLFIKYIIDKFIQNYKHKNNNNNEISMIVNINKDDINKDIYFLDNYKDISEKEHLYELNELNTKLYINKEKYTYNKYYKFKKEGEYDIKIKFNIKLKDCSYMFAGCKNIINIDFTNFKSENVENMEYMFYNCNNLKNINLLSLKTENVNNMSYMFYGCCNIKNLDLSSFVIKNNINMTNIFKNSEKLNYFNFYSLEYKNNENINYIPKTDYLKKVEEKKMIGAKTSLLKRIYDNDFKFNTMATVSASRFTKTFELKNGKKILI